MNREKTVKKIVITGGAGYIGNEIIKTLPTDCEIIIIDNFHIDTPEKRKRNKVLQTLTNITLIEANVGDVEQYSQYLSDIDVVIYMASLNSHTESNSNPSLYIKENVLMLQKFLDAVKKYSPQIQKIILTSSRGVYGEGMYDCVTCTSVVSPENTDDLACPQCGKSYLTPKPLVETDSVKPASYYGLSKQMQEDVLTQFCTQNGIELDILRIFNVYGEEQHKYYSHIGIIPQMASFITEKNELTLNGNGDLTRDFIHVRDVVTVITRAMYGKNKRKQLVEIYNLGSGVAVSLNDLADYFADLEYCFIRKVRPEYHDVRYSVANTGKVMKEFSLTEFTSLATFLESHYSNKAGTLTI